MKADELKYSHLSFLWGFSTHMSPHCLPTHSQWGRIRMVSKSPLSTMSVLASRWPFCIKLKMEQVDKVQTILCLWDNVATFWHGLRGPLNWSPSLVSSSSTCHFLPCSCTRCPVPLYSRWGTKQIKATLQNSKDWCSTSFRLQLWVSVVETRLGWMLWSQNYQFGKPTAARDRGNLR